jgi:hypothetical protein
MAMYPICPGVDRHGGLGKVAPVNFARNSNPGRGTSAMAVWHIRLRR